MLTVLLTTLRTLLLRILPHVVTTLLLTALPHVANPIAKLVLTVLPAGKNLLLGWRYWLVAAASEHLRLCVAGGRRWPAY